MDTSTLTIPNAPKLKARKIGAHLLKYKQKALPISKRDRRKRLHKVKRSTSVQNSFKNSNNDRFNTLKDLRQITLFESQLLYIHLLNQNILINQQAIEGSQENGSQCLINIPDQTMSHASTRGTIMSSSTSQHQDIEMGYEQQNVANSPSSITEGETFSLAMQMWEAKRSSSGKLPSSGLN